MGLIVAYSEVLARPGSGGGSIRSRAHRVVAARRPGPDASEQATNLAGSCSALAVQFMIPLTHSLTHFTH